MYIVSRGEICRHPQSSLRVLLDPRGTFATLPLRPPAYAPNRVQLQSLFEQVIRVLGLLPAGVGREEFHVGVTGAAILRGYLIELFLDELEIVDRGGIQQLNRVLTADQRDALERLPCPRPDRESVVECFLACARVFFPRARALAARHSIAFPEEFAAAAREHLRRRLVLDESRLW